MTTHSDRSAAPQGGSLSETAELAGWSRRLAAWLLDWVLLFIFMIAITVPVSYADGDTSGPHAGEATVLILVFPFLLIVFAYFAVLNGRGKTIGKRLLGIRAADSESLSPIGGGRGAVRELVRYALWTLVYIPGLIDGLRPLWDDRRQTWHDAAARSIVVRD